MTPASGPMPLWQKIIAGLFLCVFTAAAAHLTYSLARTLMKVEQARNWQMVSGQLEAQQLQVREKPSNAALDISEPTQSLTATYSYTVNGQTYHNSTIDFSVFSADNFSGKRKARQQHMLRQIPLHVYIDPAAPHNSVIDRSLPAESVLFCVFFILFPCGLAVLVVITLALYPFGKRAQTYAFPLAGLFHGGLALWVLINHFREYGLGGLTLLGLLSLLFVAGIYHLFKPKTEKS